MEKTYIGRFKTMEDVDAVVTGNPSSVNGEGRGYKSVQGTKSPAEQLCASLEELGSEKKPTRSTLRILLTPTTLVRGWRDSYSTKPVSREWLQRSIHGFPTCDTPK